MDRGVPISTLHLFSKLDQLLIELLKGLSADDWDSPTISPQWTVKDIAAHLLDGNLRSLSMMRDGYRGDQPTNVNSYRDLVNYLNDLNTIWVLAYKRISPKILIEQLETTGREYVKCLQQLEPFEAAMFSVAWAGEEVSENWFHIAREYTEKWHHQQQIREALGLQHPLMSREFLHPCLETFVRALPHAYRDINAPVGTIIKLVITSEGGGTWFAERTYSDWRLVKNLSNAPSAATATISDSMAWKLFTKALTPQQAQDAIQVEGEPSLIRPLLSMVAVIA